MTQVGEMAALRHGLEAVDISLAFDDFGVGQHRLAELSEVQPALPEVRSEPCPPVEHGGRFADAR